MRKTNLVSLARSIRERCFYINVDRATNRMIDFAANVRLQNLIINQPGITSFSSMLVEELSGIPAANPQPRLPGF